MSYCDSKAGWLSQHSVSKALPRRSGHSSSPASGSGAKESPWSQTRGFRVSHHLPATAGCSCCTPPPHIPAAAIPSVSRAGAAPLLQRPPSLPQGKTTSYPPPEASETTFSNASLHPFIRVSPKCHHFPPQRSPTTSFQETPSAKRIVQERSGQSL